MGFVAAEIRPVTLCKTTVFGVTLDCIAWRIKFLLVCRQEKALSIGTYALSFALAAQCLGLFDDSFYVSSDALSEDSVDIPRLPPHRHPGTNFVPAKEA
jgi:hypothetical protein